MEKSDVNKLNATGNTALVSAASLGYYKVVEFLLKNGAKVDLCDDDGAAALSCAAYRGYTEIVKLLIEEYKANVNWVDYHGNTPLLEATNQNHITTVLTLLKNDALVDVSNKNGVTAIHAAATKEHFIIVQHLIDHKADINQADKQTPSPLHVACAAKSAKVAEILLQAGACVNATSTDRQTALRVATEKGWFKIVRLLVKFGANINSLNADGRTCFHIACMLGYTQIVKFLVDSNVDINFPQQSDVDKVTGLILAVDNGKTDVVKLLLDVGTKKDRFQQIDVNFRLKDGFTALHFAVSFHVAEIRYDITKLLLEHGANTEEVNANGDTVLLLPIVADYPVIVSLLLDKGADIEFCRVCPATQNTLTVLAYAVKLQRK